MRELNQRFISHYDKTLVIINKISEAIEACISSYMMIVYLCLAEMIDEQIMQVPRFDGSSTAGLYDS